MNIEKGIITISNPNQTSRKLNLVDQSGQVIKTRTTEKEYIAAAVFQYTLKDGQKSEQTFYFGRKDLIGKGDSKFCFNLLASGGPSMNGYITKINRAILFEL